LFLYDDDSAEGFLDRGGQQFLEPTALAVMGGETARPSSAHGEVVRAFRTATHVHVVVGAPVASALSSDWGASYVLSLPR
jgi:hypothetical protein